MSTKMGEYQSLINKDNLEERDNPKKLNEGETEKTHIVSKIFEGGIIFIIEKNHNGVSVSQFINYLNHILIKHFSDEKVKFEYETIVKNDFIEELKKLNRVTSADIIVDKQLLGGASLNYSNRINSVKHNVTLSIKANVKDTIEDFVYDVFAKFNKGKNSIKKITIKGKSEENNDVIFNTDFIEKQETLICEININTGEFNSNDMFVNLNSILNNYN